MGGGGGAVDLGIDGLIPLRVLELLLDVGRQGHFPQALQHLQEDALVVEANQLVAVLQSLLHRGRQGPVAKGEGGPLLGLAARLRQALPEAVALVPEQQHLHRALGGLPMAQQPGRQHPGVVQHQTVAGIEIVQNLIEMMVADLPGLPVQGHQPGAVPPLQGRLGNELRRQLIIKIVGFQQSGLFLTVIICLAKH